LAVAATGDRIGRRKTGRKRGGRKKGTPTKCRLVV